jgi:hypothetical protein
MSIKTGRNGLVKWDATPTSPTNQQSIASINAWKLSLKTDYEDVSAFGDSNKVFIPGLRDLSGTIAGFWNSSDVTLVQASNQSTPGFLELIPNSDSDEAGFTFSGLAYMDAEIDCSLSAPKISGSFRAAASWDTP